MDKIQEILGEFFGLISNISFPNGNYCIAMKFGDQIKPIADNSKQVKITPLQNGICVYEIPREKGIETLAVFIRKTIDFNVEAKAKSKLYAEKVKELQQVFVEHTLQELETLRYVIGNEGETQYADNSVSFESKLDEAEINVDDIVEEETKKKSSKKQKKEQVDETVPNNEPEVSEPTVVSNETVIMSTGTTGMISGKVDVKL